MERTDHEQRPTGASSTKLPSTTTGEMLVAGGEHVGEALTERLDARDETVVFIDEESGSVERALDGGLTAEWADLTDHRAFENAGIDGITTAFVASGSDSHNLMIAQVLAVRLDLERLIIRVNDPRNHPAFADLGFETVDATNVLAAALAEAADPTA